MIVSESGRAVAAYHSVLIFDVLGSSALDKFQVTGDRALDYTGAQELPQPVLDLFDAYRTVSERRLVECYHDALTAREQVLTRLVIPRDRHHGAGQRRTGGVGHRERAGNESLR